MEGAEFEELFQSLEIFVHREGSEIARLKGEEPDRCVFDLWTDQLVYLEPTSGAKTRMTFHIGFPFPVLSKERTAPETLTGFNWHVFARGAPVRTLQFSQLRKALEYAGFSTRVSTLNEMEFRSLVRKALSCSPSELLYIDPYNNPKETHLGNSFIGLHFIKSMVGERYREARYLSSSWKHLAFLLPDIHPKNLEQLKRSMSGINAVIMPDLLDGRWSQTMEAILHILPYKVPVCIPGRDLVIVAEAENSVGIYRLARENVLLRDCSIDRYNKTVMAPFALNPSPETPKVVPPVGRVVVLLNPHSSTTKRDIPPRLMLELVKALRSAAPDIYLTQGVSGNPKDAQWCSDFKRLLEADASDIIVQFLPLVADLSALNQEIEQRGINFAITADTALSHFFIARGTPHLVLVNESFWDMHAAQSVATIFVRSSELQIPLYFHPDECESLDFCRALTNEIAHLLNRLCYGHSFSPSRPKTIDTDIQDFISELDAAYMGFPERETLAWKLLADLRQALDSWAEQDRCLAFLNEQSKRPWILRFEKNQNIGITHLAWSHSGLAKLPYYSALKGQ